MSDEGRTHEYHEPERPPPGPAFLEVVRGGSSTGAIAVKDAVTVGRDEACEARFAVVGVSRRHARIVREPGGTLRLLDLGSRNGTYLNGRKVQAAVLRSGDEIRVGPVVLSLRIVGETSGQTKAPEPNAVHERLSAREWEVAQLVAEGLTNGEIGDRLGISAGTVGRHLSNIYQRLEIHSRAALAHLVTKGS